MVDYLPVQPVAYRDQINLFPQSYNQFEDLHLQYSDQQKYLIGEKIGYGKYSDVFKGYIRGHEDDQEIVIKVLKPVRFIKVYREVKILTNLFYGPFIMKLLDVCSVKDSQFPAFITEFGGMSLQMAQAAANLQKIKLYIGQLLIALHYCHIHAIIHRDVKGGNICVDLTTGRLSLLDFGLAEFYKYGEKLHHRVATRHYKSPELLCNYQLYDYSLDVWSTGAMLAGFLFMRQPFFRGNDNDDQLVKIINVMGSHEFLAFLKKYKITMPKSKLNELKDFHQIPLEQFVTNQNKHLATADGIDLLDKMLQIDPEKRWTCAKLLGHKWFDEVRKELTDKYLKEFEVIKQQLANNLADIPISCLPSYEFKESTKFPVPIHPNEIMKQHVMDEEEWNQAWINFQRIGNQKGWLAQQELIRQDNEGAQQ